LQKNKKPNPPAATGKLCNEEDLEEIGDAGGYSFVPLFLVKTNEYHLPSASASIVHRPSSIVIHFGVRRYCI